MGKRRSCPSKAAVEEHVAGARLGRPNPAIEAHLAECKRCRALVEKLAEETRELAGLLEATRGEPDTPCPDDTVLAAYIDRALKPRVRRDVEQHAAQCPRCRLKLKNIRRDTDDVVSERAPAYGAAEPVKLSDRKRTKRSSKNTASEKVRPADTTDAEPRKKRLSSDFD